MARSQLASRLSRTRFSRWKKESASQTTNRLAASLGPGDGQVRQKGDRDDAKDAETEFAHGRDDSTALALPCPRAPHVPAVVQLTRKNRDDHVQAAQIG